MGIAIFRRACSTCTECFVQLEKAPHFDACLKVVKSVPWLKMEPKALHHLLAKGVEWQAEKEKQEQGNLLVMAASQAIHLQAAKNLGVKGDVASLEIQLAMIPRVQPKGKEEKPQVFAGDRYYEAQHPGY